MKHRCNFNKLIGGILVIPMGLSIFGTDFENFKVFAASGEEKVPYRLKKLPADEMLGNSIKKALNKAFSGVEVKDLKALKHAIKKFRQEKDRLIHKYAYESALSNFEQKQKDLVDEYGIKDLEKLKKDVDEILDEIDMDDEYLIENLNYQIDKIIEEYIESKYLPTIDEEYEKQVEEDEEQAEELGKSNYDKNGLEYKLNDEEKTAVLVKCKNKYIKELNIPKYVKRNETRYKVTSIGEYAFEGCSGLTSVKICNGVTEIGYSAFSGCSGLTGELRIPSSVTEIGRSAFSGCSGLTGELKIPEGVTWLGYSAFGGCSGLTGELRMPEGLKEIEEYAFDGCSGLTGELRMPEGLKEIGGSAFSGCSGLTGELRIPSSVTEIGEYAFYGCSGLTGELRMPEGLKEIGGSAFEGCSGLTGKLKIPKGVKVGKDAFYDCSGLEKSCRI